MDRKLDALQRTIDKSIRTALVESNIRQRNLDMIIEDVVKKHLHFLSEESKENSNNKNGKLSNKKRAVIQWLQEPEIDTAEIRRQLEGEPESQEEEDSKRSYFMKKVNQSYGKDFTDEEVNGLYAIKSRLGQ